MARTTVANSHCDVWAVTPWSRQGGDWRTRGPTHEETAAGATCESGTMPSPSAQVAAERPFYAAHAAAYDFLVTDPVEPWVAHVDSKLRARGLFPATILDAGCGTGRHAEALISVGHTVELADGSEPLLDQARRRCLGSPAHLLDLVDFDIGARFDAVVCRGVLNDLVGDDERQGCLDQFAKSLVPGGLVILDLREHDRSRARADGTTRRTSIKMSDTERLTFQATTTWSDGLMHVHETYCRKPNDQSAVHEYEFTMRPWTVDEAKARLTTSGFTSIAIEEGVGRATTDRFIATGQVSR